MDDTSQPLDLGKEEYFWELLQGNGPIRVQERLHKSPMGSVLDIGCAEGRTLLLLHYTQGVDHLAGFDREEAHEVLSRLNKNISDPLFSGYSALEDFWVDGFRPSGDCPRKKIHDRSQAMAIMQHVHYDTHIHDYEHPLDRYDIIIASQVLHYMWSNEISEFNYLLRERTHENSIIYFSMKDSFNAEGRPSSEILKRCHGIKQEFEHLGVKHYSGPMSKDHGRCHIFTNL